MLVSLQETQHCDSSQNVTVTEANPARTSGKQNHILQILAIEIKSIYLKYILFASVPYI